MEKLPTPSQVPRASCPRVLLQEVTLCLGLSCPLWCSPPSLPRWENFAQAESGLPRTMGVPATPCWGKPFL